jgi:NADPH:quinone reductase-like Zn-dependent oxidoreductase
MHYSAEAQFPFVAGVDGVGRLEDGTRAYFLLPRFPYGAFAEQVVVPARQCLPLPDGLDDASAAAIANPGMSSWAAFVERARLKPGETVLVNGATGVSGRLAIQIAKHLGAKKVIATGRKPEALRALAALGADVALSLVDKEALQKNLEREFAEGVDVVVDYLWGESAGLLLRAAATSAPDAAPIRFVQIGSMSGREIPLSSEILRSKAIELMGSGLGSVPAPRLLAAIAGVLQAAGPAGFRIDVEAAPLSEIERRWAEADSAHRLVFTVG